MNKFYITTSIAYTNANPHIGFALELVQADVLARYHRQRLGGEHPAQSLSADRQGNQGRALSGTSVWFLTGTDEHGIKIARAAEQAGVSPHKFVDDISGKFRILCEKLNISNDDFIRTSDKELHWPAVDKIWMKMVEAGDLYKKSYEGLYCVGHEAFIKKAELEDGLCPIHKTEPEKLKEENWFFKLTKYKDAVREKIETGELKIVPETRKNEILNLLDDAEDVSFSRPVETLKWGIPVPNDPSQTIYVWADALTNYVSALGWASDPSFAKASEGTQKLFEKFWPADVHLIGKDILRFHAMYWPAMLLSAQLPLPKAIYVHGFITVDGQKMSKSIGNVIDPFDVVEQFGADAVRYFLMREIPSSEDGDFSWIKFKDRYNGDLANGLGNLIQRVATLIDTKMEGELIFKAGDIEVRMTPARSYSAGRQIRGGLPAGQANDEGYHKAIEQFRLHDAVGEVWRLVAEANQYIDEQKPWAQQPKDFLKTMTTLVTMIHHITHLLVPFMPETAQKIKNVFSLPATKKIPENHKCVIKKGGSLFPRMTD